MKMILTVVALLALFVVPVQAQPPVIMQIDVPFEFYVGETCYPEGLYQVRPTASRELVQVSPLDVEVEADSRFVFAVPLLSDSAETSVAVFEKYDNDHTFLKSIWNADRQTGWEFPESELEREFQPIEVSAAKAPDTLTIVAQVP